MVWGECSYKNTTMCTCPCDEAELSRLREIEEAAKWLVECNSGWYAGHCPTNDDAEWEWLNTMEAAEVELKRLVGGGE